MMFVNRKKAGLYYCDGSTWEFMTTVSYVTFNLVQKTSAYTLTSLDYQIECTANSFTLTLPTAVGITGRVYSVKNNGSGTITLDGNGTETIERSLTQELSQGDNIQIMSNGSDWIII